MRKIAIAFVLFCLVASEIQSSPSAINSPQSELVIDGVGISWIVVNASTEADVIALYGDDFKLIEHRKYSYEIEYKDLGLSFYYCYCDEEKRIVAILIKAPCPGATSKGIIVGQNTLQDVFDLYGKADPRTTTAQKSLFFEYPGINFHIDYQEEVTAEAIGEEQLNKKIIAIEIVDPDVKGSVCNCL